MMRTWKMLAAVALLTAVPAPVPAGETPSPNKEVLKKIEDLRLTVESLKTKVDSVNANANYKEVLADLKRVEKVLFEHIAKVNHDLSVDLNALKDTQLKQKIELQGMTAKVKGLEDEIDLLTDRLSKLRKQLVDVPVAAATPTVDKIGLDDIRTRLSAIEKMLAGLSSKERVAFSPPLSAAKIVLRNEYPALALFTVNGQKYRLEPNQTIVLTDIPAGETTYEAIFDGFGPRGMRIVTLRPNETMTLTAR